MTCLLARLTPCPGVRPNRKDSHASPFHRRAGRQDKLRCAPLRYRNAALCEGSIGGDQHRSDWSHLGSLHPALRFRYPRGKVTINGVRASANQLIARRA